MGLNKIRLIFYMILGIVFIIGFGACSMQAETSQPDVLRVSLGAGTSDSDELHRSFMPLQRYLEQELNINVEWVPVNSYQEQLEKFHRNELDLVLFGGYAFIKAQLRDNADPLVMRDIDFQFTSYFLVAADNKATKISELKGQSFSFGSALSTSGHIMPRFFLSTQDIVPETFFSQVDYSGAHDITARWVEEKRVDVGAVNSLTIDQMFKEKKLSKHKVKILWKTPPYPDYVWTARRGLPEILKAKIIEAFVKLSPDNKQHRILLQLTGANYYFPANADDFEPIRKIALQLEMLAANDE